MITYWDLVIAPLYFIIVLLIALQIKSKNIFSDSNYKYFVKGMVAKNIGGIALCLIYVYYYDGAGDTINYYQSSVSFANIFIQKPFENFLELNFTREKNVYLLNYFDESTGWPSFGANDTYAFFVVKLLTPLCLLSFKSILGMTILLSSISYSGIWKLYQVFYKQFPEISKELAMAILFVPSVVFWGSGLLKDTITLAATGWYTYSVYNLFIAKDYRFRFSLYLAISIFLIISIKPYILFALMPGSVIWLFSEKLNRIKNKILKTLIMPLFLGTAVLIGYFVLNYFGSSLGNYSLDKVLDKAVITQRDLKRGEAYGSNYFDIGDFDASIESVSAKIPFAINAALYRPYIWEARNPVMMLSGLENAIILGLSIFLLIKIKLRNILILINRNSLLIFSVLFSMFFAYSVGLTTANFGALVRLKIPCIPFFLSSLFVLKYYYDQSKLKNKSIV